MIARNLIAWHSKFCVSWVTLRNCVHTLSQLLSKVTHVKSNFPKEYILNLSLAHADLFLFLSQNREQEPLVLVAKFSY